MIDMTVHYDHTTYGDDGPGWQYDDGGRSAVGYKGSTGDCVTRAIAIAAELPYQAVYDALHVRTKVDRATMAKLELSYGANAKRHASPRDGVFRKVYESFLKDLGCTWTPTMTIGSGCQVHLLREELPSGRIICKVSRSEERRVGKECRSRRAPSHKKNV